MTTVHAAVAHPHAIHGDASHSAGRPATTSVAASDAATSSPVVADIAAATVAAAPTIAAGFTRTGDDDASRGCAPSNPDAFRRPEPPDAPPDASRDAPDDSTLFARDFRMFCIHSVGAYPPSSLSSNDDDAARSDSGIGVQYSAAIPSPAETASFGFASRRDCTPRHVRRRGRADRLRRRRDAAAALERSSGPSSAGDDDRHFGGVSGTVSIRRTVVRVCGRTARRGGFGWAFRFGPRVRRRRRLLRRLRRRRDGGGDGGVRRGRVHARSVFATTVRSSVRTSATASRGPRRDASRSRRASTQRLGNLEGGRRGSAERGATLFPQPRGDPFEEGKFGDAVDEVNASHGARVDGVFDGVAAVRPLVHDARFAESRLDVEGFRRVERALEAPHAPGLVHERGVVASARAGGFARVRAGPRGEWGGVHEGEVVVRAVREPLVAVGVERRAMRRGGARISNASFTSAAAAAAWSPARSGWTDFCSARHAARISSEDDSGGTSRTA